MVTAPTNDVRLLITINPINALRHIEQMHSATIDNDLCQNTACYKISATDARCSFVLWVSKSEWRVCRQITLLDANVLFDTQFEYKHWNGILVPEHVVITKPSNETRIEQQYSEHAYSSTD
jgi:hypothetical protein